MTTLTTNPVQLQYACRIIFGNKIVITPEFIDYLQVSGLRDAYKKAALQNHPDRAVTQNISADILSQRFRRIQESYELLHNHISNRQLTHDKQGSTDNRNESIFASFIYKWFRN